MNTPESAQKAAQITTLLEDLARNFGLLECPEDTAQEGARRAVVAIIHQLREQYGLEYSDSSDQVTVGGITVVRSGDTFSLLRQRKVKIKLPGRETVRTMGEVELPSVTPSSPAAPEPDPLESYMASQGDKLSSFADTLFAKTPVVPPVEVVSPISSSPIVAPVAVASQPSVVPPAPEQPQAKTVNPSDSVPAPETSSSASASPSADNIVLHHPMRSFVRHVRLDQERRTVKETRDTERQHASQDSIQLGAITTQDDAQSSVSVIGRSEEQCLSVSKIFEELKKETDLQEFEKKVIELLGSWRTKAPENSLAIAQQLVREHNHFPLKKPSEAVIRIRVNGHIIHCPRDARWTITDEKGAPAEEVSEDVEVARRELETAMKKLQYNAENGVIRRSEAPKQARNARAQFKPTTEAIILSSEERNQLPPIWIERIRNRKLEDLADTADDAETFYITLTPELTQVIVMKEVMFKGQTRLWYALVEVQPDKGRIPADDQTLRHVPKPAAKPSVMGRLKNLFMRR